MNVSSYYVRFIALTLITIITPHTQAATLTVSSVTENFAPSLTINVSCLPNVDITGDGLERINSVVSQGYCPLPPVPDSYEVTYTFSPLETQAMTSLTVWANAGGGYSDGELRSFDLEVDYLNNSGNPATLTMPGVNIGETLSINDPKTVTLIDGASSVELLGVTEVRISNLDGFGVEFAWREIFGEFVTKDNDLTTVKRITSGNNFPAVGDIVTFEITVTNNGTDEANAITLVDLLSSGLTPTIQNGSTTNGSYNRSNGTWFINSLPSNTSATLTLQGTVDAGQEGNIINDPTTAADNLVNDELDTNGDILTVSVTISNPSLNVTKLADKTVNVPAGEVITYTYTVKNTGNVAISEVSLLDVHNGSGSLPTPTNPTLLLDSLPTGDSFDTSGDNIWATLAPNDEIQFTSTYTVTQSDIDTLQ